MQNIDWSLILVENSDGFLIKIRVVPGSSRSVLIGILDHRLKVKITAPPVDGEANKALIEYFSKLFRVSKSQIHLIRGETSKNKDLLVRGLYLENALEIIKNELLVNNQKSKR